MLASTNPADWPLSASLCPDPSLRIAYRCRFASAVEDLSDALSFARSRKAGLENESRILADWRTPTGWGDTASTLPSVHEATKVATECHRRSPECLVSRKPGKARDRACATAL